MLGCGTMGNRSPLQLSGSGRLIAVQVTELRKKERERGGHMYSVRTSLQFHVVILALFSLRGNLIDLDQQ